MGVNMVEVIVMIWPEVERAVKYMSSDNEVEVRIRKTHILPPSYIPFRFLQQ